MALSAATVWEARASGASDNNGGGFVAGATGTDFSQQNAAQASGTDLVVDATTNTKVTSATHNFVAADVGNLIQITAGAGYTTGFYQIVSVAANAATLDRSPAAVGTTGGTWAEGGALATLGKLSGAMVASNKGYVTGAFTSTATNVFSTASGRLIGYGAARGDATHATLTLQTNTGLTGLSFNQTWIVEQVDVDCGSLGTSTGIACTSNQFEARNCKVSNFTTAGINLGGNQGTAFSCEVTGGTAAATAGIIAGAAPGIVERCFIHDNACPGVVSTAISPIVRFCLIVNNTGASSDGVRHVNTAVIMNNTIHGNGRDGIRNTGASANEVLVLNNILTSNGGFGMTGSSGAAQPASPDWDGNAFFNNTSGARNLYDSVTGIFGVTPYTNVRDVTLTASPYVGPTTGTTANFALNNTAGAGGACRAVGSPGTWPGNTGTTGNLDMGAVQSRGGILSNPSLEGIGA